jgi:hypothetical protein
MMKKLFQFAVKTFWYCVLLYGVCALRNPSLRPDLGPTVRALGTFIRDLYPDENVVANSPKDRNDKAVMAPWDDDEKVKEMVRRLKLTPME